MIELKDLHSLSESIIEFKDVVFIPPSVIESMRKKMKSEGKSEKEIEAAITSAKNLGTLSIQGKNAIDSHITSYIEDYNEEYDRWVLAQEDLVKAYNQLIEADFDAILKTLEPYEGKVPEPPKSVYDASSAYVNYTNQIANIRVGARTVMASSYKNLVDLGYPEHVARKYIIGQLYEKTEDPEKIREIIKSRLQYNELMIKSLSTMIKGNAKLLGLTETAAEMLSNQMQNGTAVEKQNAITASKNVIAKELNNQKYNKGKYYDYRELGAGCLFIADVEEVSLAKFANFINDKSALIQRLMQFDAVVIGHGGDIDKQASEFMAMHEKYMGKMKQYLNSRGMSLQATGQLANFTTLVNQFDALSSIMINMHKNGTGKVGQKIALKAYETYANFLLKSLEAITDGENKDLAKKHKDLMKSYLKTKSTINDAMWYIQPVYTLNGGPFTDVVKLVDQLVKEGFKRIYLGCCNPGHHKLPDRIAKSDTVSVAMGNNSVLIEVCDYAMTSSGDEILHEAANNVYDSFTAINELAHSCNINIETLDDSCIKEAWDYLNDDSNFVMNEGSGGSIWSKIWEGIKRAIKAILHLFHKIIEMCAKFIKYIYNKLTGKSKKKTPLKKKFKSIAAFLESAKMVEYEVGSIADIQRVMTDSGNKMSAALKRASQEQTRNMNQYEELARKLAGTN